MSVHPEHCLTRGSVCPKAAAAGPEGLAQCATATACSSCAAIDPSTPLAARTEMVDASTVLLWRDEVLRAVCSGRQVGSQH